MVVRSGQMSEEELSRDWGRRYLETGRNANHLITAAGGLDCSLVFTMGRNLCFVITLLSAQEKWAIISRSANSSSFPPTAFDYRQEEKWLVAHPSSICPRNGGTFGSFEILFSGHGF